MYRITGIIFIACSVFGFLTVADDLRHTGEAIGVAALFIAGIILFFVKSTKTIFKHFALQWVAFGILFGIPIGGVVLDNMYFGIAIGIVIGILTAFVAGRKK